jgi:hypothetical protein
VSTRAPLSSIFGTHRDRAMWDTTLFVVLADNGGAICTAASHTQGGHSLIVRDYSKQYK